MKYVTIHFKWTLFNLFRPAARTLTLYDVGYSVGAHFVTVHGELREYVFPVSSIKRIVVRY